jgi:hypothetical protein
MVDLKDPKTRQDILDEIKRKRAAAAQSEGILGAAERGEYGDVGQGGPKGEFDDEINQDPGDEDVTQSAFSVSDIPELVPLLDTVSPTDLSSKGINALIRRRFPALIAADLISSNIPAPIKKNIATKANEIYSGIFNKAREALGFEPQYVMNADGSLSMTGAGPFQLLKREVKNPGSGSGMPGVGTKRGATKLEKAISEKRNYVNKKLKEIYDEAPIDKDTGLPMLSSDWFKSKKVKQQIYDSNPKLFPEWKDGIGSWNDLGSGFLAGKFKKVKGKRVYTGDKVDSASLLVSGADSPAKKATKDFEKAVAKKLNVDSIKPQEQTLKYLNFIRLSESDELLKNSDKFFKKYNFDDLTTPGTKLNENFEKFKILDNKRKVLRDDPAIQAVIKKIFPDTEVKFDIAHTFELGQVRKGKVSKSKLGKGGDPDDMYIDLSITNRSIQKDLESKAKQLEELYTQTGNSEILEALQKISKKMSDLGVEGQTVTKVGDLQSGFILGKKGENLSDKLQALAKRQGVELTDADYEILLKADNIINPPKQIMQGAVELKNRGGMVGISHLTRPL